MGPGRLGMRVLDPGGDLHMGDAIVRLDSLRPRCPITTVDPDTLDADPAVLRDIGRRFHGRLALNADVTRGGTIACNDLVTLVRPADRARRVTGSHAGFRAP